MCWGNPVAGASELAGFWKGSLRGENWRSNIHHFLHEFGIKISTIFLWGVSQNDICDKVQGDINMV